MTKLELTIKDIENLVNIINDSDYDLPLLLDKLLALERALIKEADEELTDLRDQEAYLINNIGIYADNVAISQQRKEEAIEALNMFREEHPNLKEEK